jgi:hypothetical protein
MRIIPATLALFALACISTAPTYAADITFHKTLKASGTVALNVCSNSGLIHVTGVDGSKIEISANVHKSNWHAVGNSDEMKKIAATPPVQQTGNIVRVGDSTTCSPNVLHDIDIDYEISVPKNSTLTAKNGAGAIHVESIHGFVRARNGSGDITVNGIGAESMLESGSGNLDIQAAHGMLLAKTGSGNVNIHDSDVTDSQLKSGSGNIAATNLKGGLRVSTGSGNISMAGTPTADWMMRTGKGTIQFQAAGDAKFELDAETGAGTIDSTLPTPLSGHITTGVLRGPVRGGGPVVKMYTGAGNITLQ